jgi:hypothetical protein
MKYIELTEVEFTTEQLKAAGNYPGSTSLWEGKPNGAYIVNDGVTKHLVVWSGLYGTAMVIGDLILLDTKPKLEEDIIHKYLVKLSKQIEHLGESTVQPKTNAIGLDNDTFLKALALSQNPELIKGM